MAQIYVYIVHKGGVADDTAIELVTAAKKIDPDASVSAIVTGSGADLEAVCKDVASTYNEVIKIDNAALAYPNAEIIRGILLNILPKDAVLLLTHDTFGMDLGPGLSIKLESAFVADVVDFEGLDGSDLKIIRQEYSGQVSTHVVCNIGSGAVINIRPGAFTPDESKSASGEIVDKSSEAGDLAARRTFIETVVAEVGDVDITKSEVLV